MNITEIKEKKLVYRIRVLFIHVTAREINAFYFCTFFRMTTGLIFLAMILTWGLKWDHCPLVIHFWWKSNQAENMLSMHPSLSHEYLWLGFSAEFLNPRKAWPLSGNCMALCKSCFYSWLDWIWRFLPVWRKYGVCDNGCVLIRIRVRKSGMKVKEGVI